jgi:hypothetical protein
MKRNPRNRTRFQLKPLKIELSEAEILADLRYGVDGQTRRLRERRQVSASR